MLDRYARLLLLMRSTIAPTVAVVAVELTVAELVAVLVAAFAMMLLDSAS